MKVLLLTVIFGCFLINVSQAYIITVDAHAEECFFEKTTAGTKLGLTFEVAEGGFLDIDVSVRKQPFLLLYHTLVKLSFLSIVLFKYKIYYVDKFNFNDTKRDLSFLASCYDSWSIKLSQKHKQFEINFLKNDKIF